MALEDMWILVSAAGSGTNPLHILRDDSVCVCVCVCVYVCVCV